MICYTNITYILLYIMRGSRNFFRGGGCPKDNCVCGGGGGVGVRGIFTIILFHFPGDPPPLDPRMYIKPHYIVMNICFAMSCHAMSCILHKTFYRSIYSRVFVCVCRGGGGED